MLGQCAHNTQKDNASMGLVLEGFLALAAIVALAWQWSLRSSVGKDMEAAKQKTKARERERQIARLYRTEEPLRCLGCGASFGGPLGERGCPKCHLAVLVVTEKEYERGQQTPPHEAEGNG